MIDFDKINELEIPHFKDGDGSILMRKFEANGITVLRNTLHKGCSLGLHKHEETFEFIYIISGTATFTTSNGTEVVKAGQAHYLPKGGTHAVKNNYDEDLVMLCFIG